VPKFVFLWTDRVLYLLLVAIAFYVWHALRTPTLRQTWRVVVRDASAIHSRLDPFPVVASPGARL